MGTKTVKIKFDPNNPDEAVRKAISVMNRHVRDRARQYRQVVEEKADVLGQRIANEGVVTAASMTVTMAAYDSGELMSSFKGEYDTGSRHGQIYTDCGHAKFVEFGTGVVGAESPYENPNISTAYDIHGHGEEGWIYSKNGRPWWTQGQPSRPFMWMTAQDLRVEIPHYAQEIFAKARVSTK